MIELPMLRSYGPGGVDNPNRKVLQFNCGVDLYFSYETPVGMHVEDKGLFLCYNHWGHTTGRHMSLIKGRIDKPTPAEEGLTETGLLRRWHEYAVPQLLDLDWVRDPTLRQMLAQALAGDLVSRLAVQDYLMERI